MFKIEGLGCHDNWSTDNVGDIPVDFETESEALMAVNDLVENLDWYPERLRIVEG